VNIIVPLTLTDAMIGAGTTVAEPAAGETAWVSGGTYVAGDKRIRSTTHRVYLCSTGHTGRTALPEVDTAYWTDAGPTQRWAPFDTYVSTAAATVTSLTYVLSPGYFNAVSLYGLTGTNLAITVKDAPGGAVIYSSNDFLAEPPLGWYEYLFSPVKPINKVVKTGIPIRPTAELTVTVSAASGAAVGIGMLNIGDYVPLVGDVSSWGGTQYGASADPVSYSYIETAPDGTVSIVRRTSATGMRAAVVLPRNQADAALAVIQDVLDVPVSWIATDKNGYKGLNVFGLGSASVVYEGPEHASININVKGMI